MMIIVKQLNTNYSEIPTGEIDTTLEAFVKAHDLRIPTEAKIDYSRLISGTYCAYWGNGEGKDDFLVMKKEDSLYEDGNFEPYDPEGDEFE